MSSMDELRELEGTFSEVAVALFAPGTVERTLQRIVPRAVRTVDGCEAAGIMLMGAEAATTVAATSDLVIEIDQMQIDANEGPCVDAATQSTAFYANDLLDEPRWPVFAPNAVAAGVRSVLAYSLSTGQPGALNLYARLPAAFGATDRAQGELFATLARLALDSAEERAAGESTAVNFSAALLTRELIGQAQGILMERERISADQAFDILRRASQHMNIKLREVAETLVETGESPDTGRPATT
jgi:hypothetical protein